MKICPTCQQQFPNGFQYCPSDTDMLITAEEYLRRTRPIIPPVTPPAPPAAEVVRTAQRAPVEPPTAATVPLPPPTQQTREIPRPRVETQAPRIEARPNVPPQTTPYAAPPPKQPTQPVNQMPNGNGVRGNGYAAKSAAAFLGGSDLTFSIPESGSLLSRLGAALSNFSEAFKSAAPLKPGETGDFVFLLKDESLVSRFGRELGSAYEDFKRDPKGFTIATIKGEGANKMRQRWILNGAASVVIIYSFLFFVIPTLFLLWKGPQVQAAKEETEELAKLTDLTDMPKVETKVEKAPKQAEKGKGGFTGGSKPIIKQATGGGGGGREQITPPSKGVPPQMALTPQIIPPNPEPPKIKNPSLVVASTIYGDPKAMPPQKGPIGDPLGVPAPPSSGPGRGAGIGTGEGTGVGRGEGGGAGAGRGGNVGGGDMGLGGGRGPGGSGGIEEMGKNGAGRPTILYKEKAKYTEEARQNKVQGTVVLNVIFTAEGRITSIRVVRGLPDGLTEKAIEAAQRIRFNPATKNGAPVSVRGNLEFSFNLY
jgi:TonB family protein